jgi:hypothetical protein
MKSETSTTRIAEVTMQRGYVGYCETCDWFRSGDGAEVANGANIHMRRTGHLCQVEGPCREPTSPPETARETTK